MLMIGRQVDKYIASTTHLMAAAMAVARPQVSLSLDVLAHGATLLTSVKSLLLLLLLFSLLLAAGEVDSLVKVDEKNNCAG